MDAIPGRFESCCSRPLLDKHRRLVTGLSSNYRWRPFLIVAKQRRNYQMKVPLEAIRFNQECAAMQSPYQEQAAKSIPAIKSEFGPAQ